MQHLRHVYGAYNIPRSLYHVIKPPTWQAQPDRERPVFDTMPGQCRHTDSEELNAHAERLTGLVVQHCLSKAFGLPRLAHKMVRDPKFDASDSFEEFAGRLVAAAVRSFYRKADLPQLLTRLGEEECSLQVRSPSLLALIGRCQRVRVAVKASCVRSSSCACTRVATALRAHPQLSEYVQLEALLCTLLPMTWTHRGAQAGIAEQVLEEVRARMEEYAPCPAELAATRSRMLKHVRRAPCCLRAPDLLGVCLQVARAPGTKWLFLRRQFGAGLPTVWDAVIARLPAPELPKLFDGNGLRAGALALVLTGL